MKFDKLITINLQVYTMFKKIWFAGAFSHVDIENMARGFFFFEVKVSKRLKSNLYIRCKNNKIRLKNQSQDSFSNLKIPFFLNFEIRIRDSDSRNLFEEIWIRDFKFVEFCRI